MSALVQMLGLGDQYGNVRTQDLRDKLGIHASVA